ncbi:hypothetical protein Tco_0011381 [Tanacetum coccineum]
MKIQADKQRSNIVFEEGASMYLKLQPYRHLTIRQGKQHMFSSKFFGPFQILESIGKVAYKLQLPTYAMVHTVFHVFQLKPCHYESASMGVFPQCDVESLLSVTPLEPLERKMVKQGKVFGIIQWTNGSVDDTTWENLADVVQRFPDFVLDP